MRSSTILRIGLAMIFVAAVLAGLIFLPTHLDPGCLLEWIQSQGAWGLVLLVALDAIICLLFLPGSALTLAAGFLFGVLWGTVRPRSAPRWGRRPRSSLPAQRCESRSTTVWRPIPSFGAVDRAIGDQGFKVVLLTRLCSLFPYDLMSYLFGLTNVSLGRYVLATWLGRLPETLVWAYAGSLAKSLADLAAGNMKVGMLEQILLGVGLAAMVAATVVIAHVARQALRNVVDNSNPQGDAGCRRNRPLTRCGSSPISGSAGRRKGFSRPIVDTRLARCDNEKVCGLDCPQAEAKHTKLW